MSRDLERLLAAKEIVVTCGSGGVGKTTTAAALGVLAVSRLEARVLVLTVDPARRLADALGVGALGGTEVKIEPDRFAEAGLSTRGELWAAMLDVQQGWDDLIARHAPDAATRDALLANPVYASISGRFVQSHDYLAMERLYELHATGRFDLIVIDTPPSRHALDVLDAPARMSEFFGGRLLRWLTMPARNRLLAATSKPFFDVADRILGSQFLGDIVEFFTLLQTMEKGFVQRADAVAALVADRRTSFVVVSTLEAAPAREAEFLIAELARRRLPLGALVLNKVLPGWLVQPEPAASAAVIARRLDALAPELAASAGLDPAAVARVLRQVGTSFDELRTAARFEAEQRAELGAAPDVTVTVPYLDRDVTDLAALAAVFGVAGG